MKKELEKFEFIVSENEIGQRLDKFININLENSTRAYIEKLIDNSCVELNGKITKKNGTKLKANDKIILTVQDEEESDIVAENIPLKIVYENENFIVINKDPFIVVHPANGNYSGTLVNALLYHTKSLSDLNGNIRPGIIHRLDKNTSGLLIVAKDNFSHAKLASMFVDKKISKTYICIVKGNFSEDNLKGQIENLIGRDPLDRKKMTVVEKNGKIAISNYKVVEMKNNFSLVAVKIKTGRTHQIRVHMKYLNHPILGDEIYGNENQNSIANRQMLHAYNLQFINPIDNKEYNFYGDFPQDFVEVAKKLHFNLDNIKEAIKDV